MATHKNPFHMKLKTFIERIEGKKPKGARVGGFINGTYSVRYNAAIKRVVFDEV